VAKRNLRGIHRAWTQCSSVDSLIPWEAGAAEFPKSDKLWSWVKDNIKLPKERIRNSPKSAKG
jgi:hypothetical protein